MGLFTKKKQAEKLKEDGKQKQKAEAEPPAKYMHTPRHAYIDALSTSTASAPDREGLHQAAERRRSRLSRNNSMATTVARNGLHSAHSSSGTLALSSWEMRKQHAHNEQLRNAAVPVAAIPAKREYQSSPLASILPSPAESSSAASSYAQIPAAQQPQKLTPALMPASRPSLKKSVSIQEPPPRRQPPPVPAVEEPEDTPLVTILEPVMMHNFKAVDFNAVEVPGDTSSEEEKEKELAQKNNKNKRRLSFFRRSRFSHNTVAAAA